MNKLNSNPIVYISAIGWNGEIYTIDPATRFLIIEHANLNQEVVTDLKDSPFLQGVYLQLANETWGEGSAGKGDLLEGLI